MVSLGELAGGAGGALAGVGGSSLLRLTAFLGGLSVSLTSSAVLLAAVLPLPFDDGLAGVDATALPFSACLLARVAAQLEACSTNNNGRLGVLPTLQESGAETLC